MPMQIEHLFQYCRDLSPFCKSHMELSLLFSWHCNTQMPTYYFVTSVRFEGGCNGNTKGISALVVGMKVEEVIKRLEGIRCGFKGTSCPDQLAQALKSME